MGWVHTWGGLVLGSLLFAVFWMGTLTVFDKEIDRWMMPQTRIPSTESYSLDILRPKIENTVDSGGNWSLYLPEDRAPTGGFGGLVYQNKEGRQVRRPVNFEAGEILPEAGSLGGTRFIFPFHYKLHLGWKNLGYWLVGAAGMAMLLTLVSGVIIHTRFLKDFFTLRIFKSRVSVASLDVHTVGGVLTLPFCFLITLSGLAVFFHTYFPRTIEMVYAEEPEPVSAFSIETFGRFHREPAGIPASRQASLDGVLNRAREAWDGGEPWILSVNHPGDRNGYIRVRRAYPDTITRGRDTLWFDAVSGEELHRFSEGPVKTLQSWLLGFHFIQFDHWILRWLYFISGLGGCAVIATGFLYWLAVRRRKQGLTLRYRLVRSLAIGSITGIIIATFGFFVSNRLLPPDASLGHWRRPQLEIVLFFMAWLISFFHGGLRRGVSAWIEQCQAIAVLAVMAVLLNAITTGDHLWDTMSRSYWPVAGMDLLLLTAAAIAVWAAHKLGKTRPEKMTESLSEPAAPASRF